MPVLLLTSMYPSYSIVKLHCQCTAIHSAIQLLFWLAIGTAFCATAPVTDGP